MLKVIESMLNYHWVGKKSLILAFLYLKNARCCIECKKNFLCSGCDKKTNQIKYVAPSLHELKRQPANLLGHMLPWCFDDLDEKLQRVSAQFFRKHSPSWLCKKRSCLENIFRIFNTHFWLSNLFISIDFRLRISLFKNNLS